MTDTDTKPAQAGTDLQALSDAATAGPWEACDLGDYGDYDGKCRVILGDDKRIVVVLHGGNEANRRECDATIEYIVALVNAHREGRLVERGQPVVTDAMVERVMDLIEERLCIVWIPLGNREVFAGELRDALEDRMTPAPDVPMPTEGEK